MLSYIAWQYLISIVSFNDYISVLKKLSYRRFFLVYCGGVTWHCTWSTRRRINIAVPATCKLSLVVKCQSTNASPFALPPFMVVSMGALALLQYASYLLFLLKVIKSIIYKYLLLKMCYIKLTSVSNYYIRLIIFYIL
jgi:hypothetical protein